MCVCAPARVSLISKSVAARRGVESAGDSLFSCFVCVCLEERGGGDVTMNRIITMSWEGEGES